MSNDVAYQVNLDTFTGPFDVLLKAIEEGEIDIFNISLSQITASYFDYWKRIEPPLVLAADFLTMAAYLLEYKSKRMLPINEELIIVEDDPSNIESSLMAHLEEYAFYKNVAVTLKQKKEIFEKIFARHEGESVEKEFELKDVSLKDLVFAFKKIYDAAQKRDSIRTIADEEITLEMRIAEIKALIEDKKGVVALDEIFFRGTRIEIVVSFLAILELAKQGFIRIAQDKRFEMIYLFRKGEIILGPDINHANSNTTEINS